MFYQQAENRGLNPPWFSGDVWISTGKVIKRESRTENKDQRMRRMSRKVKVT